MARPKLVSECYDDLGTSDSSETDSDFEDDQNVECGKINESYANEIEERKKYVQEFIDKSFEHFKKGLDLSYIHDQDMNYYQETYSYEDDRPMLGALEDHSQDAASDEPEYDPDYDEEVNRLLDEVDQEILQEHSNSATEKKTENGDDYDPKKEQYQDCYDEFPDDMHHVGPIPAWYQKMLQTKLKQTKSRLEHLSNLVCYACATTGAHIKRIEQDHSTTFCKIDPPRHPPLNKPWTNFWKFNCMIKCREINKPNHAHTADCESVLLEHANTGVSTATKNISENDYPKFVMEAVELFQDFAIETTKNVPFLDSTAATDTVYEKPVWTEMKLRSNYKNELQIIVRGKGVTSLIGKLKRYFDSGPGRTSNVISVFCTNQKWSQKKNNFLPQYVTGIFKIRDKVGPISINYEPKTSVSFNSVEAMQIGKIIEDYANLTKETTFLDVGCNFGVLSLMMAHRCDRVIGLNTMHFVTSEINQAEELKKFNNLHNVSFMGCDPKDVLTKCSSIIRRSITVAALNLASPYGKSIHVMQALRDLPSVWRVIVYGSFAKEYHRNISMLTCKDDMMGPHYLPMQGCIIDKSPSVEDAFDVVILFERKSLITPTLDLLAPGPTLNVKDDTDINSYGSLDEQEKPTLKIEKGFGKHEFRTKHYPGVPKPPFIKYKKPASLFAIYDSPMLPMDKEQQTPENQQNKSKEKSPSPPNERRFDCSIIRKDIPVVPDKVFDQKKATQYPPSIKKEIHGKPSKRPVGNPPVIIIKEESMDSNRSSSPPVKERTFDCSAIRRDIPIVPNKVFDQKKGTQYPPSIKKELHGKPSKRTFGSSPVITIKEESQDSNRSSSPPVKERTFDCSVIRRDIPVVPDKVFDQKKVTHYPPSIKKEIHGKPPKRTFGSSPVTMIKEESLDSNRSSSPPVKERTFDCSAIRRDIPVVPNKVFDQKKFKREPQHPLISKEAQLREKSFKAPCPSISVRKEFQMSCPTPPRESFSSPTLPPSTEKSFFDTSNIKKEKDTDHLSMTTVKSEPMDLCDDKEEGELSPEDVGIPRAHDITYSPVSPSYFVGFSNTNHGNVTHPVTVKSEPADNYNTSFHSVRVKNEPEDMQISPEDLQNMETPIHQPRALSGSYSAPVATSANVTTLDGFEFSVSANKSYLPSKHDPERQNVVVKTEPRDDFRQESGEEVEIISESPRKQPKEPETRIRVKSLDDIIKVKSEEQSDDLRTLIEQRKQLQRRLDRECEIRCYKDLHGRSPSPDLPQRYKRLSPSPSPPRYKKYDRSPSPHRYKKYDRSPSPPRRRSPSEEWRRYKRSPPSPARTWDKRERSPSDRRYRRSPSPSSRLSPARTRVRRERSPIDKRWKRSPSPRIYVKRERSRSPSRYKRSPSPRTRVKREKSPSSSRWRRSPSPSERRHRKGPSPVHYKREPHSPIRFKRDTVSPASSTSSYRRRERSRRSPSSPTKSHHESRKRRTKSRSPVEAKRKRVLLSPISLSPSPPKHTRDKKKDKKSESKSKSKSPSRTSKKKIRTVKEETNSNIPAVSTLSNNPETEDQATARDETNCDVPATRTLPSNSKTEDQAIARDDTNCDVPATGPLLSNLKTEDQATARDETNCDVPATSNLPPDTETEDQAIDFKVEAPMESVTTEQMELVEPEQEPKQEPASGSRSPTPIPELNGVVNDAVADQVPTV